MDLPLSRDLAKGFLGRGWSVMGFGLLEAQLGSLKAQEGFSFQKVDLVKHSIVRSWLYGITDVLFVEGGSQVQERMDKVYQSILHLRSKIPRIVLLSTNQVFYGMGIGPHSEKVEILDTEDMHPLRGAEIMITNYAQHLDTPACIVRIPRIIGGNFTDTEVKRWILSLKKMQEVQLPSDSQSQFQFISVERLLSSLCTLLDSRWSNLEIFHASSYCKPLPVAFQEFLSTLNPKCQILNTVGTKQKLINWLATFPQLRSFLMEKNLWMDYSFLEQPVLNTEDSDRLFKPVPEVLAKLFKP